MPDIWPETVPHCRLLDASDAVGDGRLRAETDQGPAKVRRRSSAVVDLRAGQIKVNEAQWQALLLFGRDSLLGWTLPFLFPDAGGDLVRFGETLPTRSRVAPNTFLVDLKFEVLP